MDALLKPGLEFYIIFFLLLAAGVFIFTIGKRKDNLFIKYAGCGILAGIVLISLLLIVYFVWFMVKEQ